MRMLPENHAFWIRGEDGQEYGPVNAGELREWVLENRAGLGTEVRRDDPGAAWREWQTYPELVALLAEVQVTSPMARVPGLVIAPIRRRVVALMVDLMLWWILLIPITNVLQLFLPMNVILQSAMSVSGFQELSPETLNQVLIFEFIIDGCLVLYSMGFTAAHGKTPGKAVMRLRVIQENGAKPTLVRSFVRAVVLVLSINFLFPLLYPLFNPQRRALHDFIADTYVVEA
jgi:uncharacterized RDD family membrane protein YckC